MKYHLLLLSCLLAAFTNAPLQGHASEHESKIMARETCFFTGLSAIYDDMKEAAATDTSVCWVKPYKVIDYSKSIFGDLPWRKRIGIQRAWTLMREEHQTVLHCYFVMPYDAVKDVWLGGDETYIVDSKTGVHYKSRGTTDAKMWNRLFGIKAPAGAVVEFLVYFPPLPPTTKDIQVYGVHKWNMRGKHIKILDAESDVSYDTTIPSFHKPRLAEAKSNYNKDDMDTYDIYVDAHLIRPVKERTIALWRTPEVTYLAMAFEINWTQEYFSVPSGTTLVDQHTGTVYRLRQLQGLPLDKLFFIRGVVGDYVAFIMEFEPLPLTVNTIIYNEPAGEPFDVWGANWEAVIIKDLNVSQLVANQPLFEYLERTIVE